MISKSTFTIENFKRKIVDDLKLLDKEKFAIQCIKQTMNYHIIAKDVKYSERAKSAGNNLYTGNNLDFTELYKVLSHYNESIAYAPLNSELMATAYTNKTAILLRMRKYDECIIEVDKALKITEIVTLKIKLMCRKAQCLTALGLADSRGCVEKARFHLTKLEDSKGMKEKMLNMIETTQAVVDKQMLDIPKENKKKMHAIKMVSDAEKADFWNTSITTEYSEKYGRHLVAKRDFEPGDIISVEKPFYNNLHDCRVYQYCYHCFNHLWTVVPCDHCHWRLFCSEKCKTEAWSEYHEMDCSLVCHLRSLYEKDWENKAFLPFLAGFFCKVLKQAGSIKHLLAVSESMGNIRDSKDFSFDPEYKSYKSLFTLPVSDVAESEYPEIIRSCTLMLIGIAKYTKILPKKYEFKDMKKLSKDRDAVLLGALLLKLSIIVCSGCPKADLVDVKEMCKDPRCECKPPPNQQYTLLMLHTVSRCVPNCESIRTYNNKNIIFALQPIKAGTPLYLYTRAKTVYDSVPKSERQACHYRLYHSPCECEACTEDWLEYLNDSTGLGGIIEREMETPGAQKLWTQRNFILQDWQMNSHKPGFPDVKMVHKTLELVKETWKHYKMPSAMIIRAVTLLLRMFIAFHNPCEIVSKIDLLRSQQIGSTISLDTPEKIKLWMAKMQIFS